MGKQRKNYTGQFKAKVVLEVLKGEMTTQQIAKKFGVHPQMLTQWKKKALEGLPQVMSDKRNKDEQEQEDLTNQLYQQIGQLKVELDWLKKNLDYSSHQKKRLIESNICCINISRQCELLGLPRSTFYYKESQESQENLQLMKLIDQQYLKTPFYGYRRMTVYLKGLGFDVNFKRVLRLMRLIGLQAIYPKKNLSKGDHAHKIYPYLLRNYSIQRPNQVWATDITYIPLSGGFVYLVAIIDWYSRYVLSWEVSNTMDTSFCLVALEEAFKKGKPEIFNSDQGSQFTSNEFTSRIEKAEVKVSMDGKGRVFDNIFIERLWRSVKYEEVYIKDYLSVKEAVKGLQQYFYFYNNERPHQSLKYKTPESIHYQ